MTDVERQPESYQHGDAWRYYLGEMRLRKFQYTRDTWLAFLAGWLAKAKQHDALRGRYTGKAPL